MWLYQGKEFIEVPEGIVGFVYKITNTLNGREYIGKKLLTFSKTKQVKGKKKRVKVESDWKIYWGSNKILQGDVISQGVENFTREILYLCETKGICNYHEARLQFLWRVLEYPDKYYNEWVFCKIHRKHLKLKKLDV